MLIENGLARKLESQTSYYVYSDVESRKAHDLKTWNRATAPWSISCEIEGKTREQALKKTQIQLTFSGGE